MKRIFKYFKMWFSPNRELPPDPIERQPAKPATMADLCARIKVMTMSDEHREALDAEYLTWKEHYMVVTEITKDLNSQHKLS